jgi:hypothetical protein
MEGVITIRYCFTVHYFVFIFTFVNPFLGHFARECMEPKKEERCYMCGTPGHRCCKPLPRVISF